MNILLLYKSLKFKFPLWACVLSCGKGTTDFFCKPFPSRLIGVWRIGVSSLIYRLKCLSIMKKLVFLLLVLLQTGDLTRNSLFAQSAAQPAARPPVLKYAVDSASVEQPGVPKGEVLK